MKKTTLLFGLINLFLLSGAAVQMPEQGREVTLIRNVTLIDGTGREPQKGISLVIEDGRIQSVATAKDYKPPQGAKVVDLTGKTGMPALIYTHAPMGLLQGTRINEPFFRQSLEPGVLEMIQSEDFRSKLKNAPGRSTDMAAFKMALRNVKKLHDAGCTHHYGF